MNGVVAPQALGRVAVLMGGWAAEREISLRSGDAVLHALQGAGVDAFGVDLQHPGEVFALGHSGCERCFIALHGRGGEDGQVQAVLELLGLPYTGSGVLGSALAMDKLRSKLVWRGYGLPTPDFIELNGTADDRLAVQELGLPLMVKPTAEGSSIGMSRVDRIEELEAAYARAAANGDAVLAERWIHGAEYTVALVGSESLPVIRVATPHGFYDYAAKYQSSSTEYHVPCGLPAQPERELRHLARVAFEALGASGWGRVDLLIDPERGPQLIEANTVPGMTDHSLVPMAARAGGISFEALCLRILAQTLEGQGGR